MIIKLIYQLIGLFAILGGIDYLLQATFPNEIKRLFTLTSPQFVTTDDVSCFTFYYYFMADSSHDNEIYVTLYNEHGSFFPIWSSAGINIDGWFFAEAQIDQPGTYKVSRVHFLWSETFLDCLLRSFSPFYVNAAKTQTEIRYNHIQCIVT